MLSLMYCICTLLSEKCNGKKRKKESLQTSVNKGLVLLIELARDADFDMFVFNRIATKETMRVYFIPACVRYVEG